MGRAPSDHVRDIVEAIDAIETYASGGKRGFDGKAIVRDAICARLIQIGQSVKDAQAEGMRLDAMRPEIPWRSIAGMRDRLAHKYALLDKELVWAVVVNELPRLRLAVEAILANVNRRS